MSPELRSTLLGWLATGTEAQRAHARHRLSLPDAMEPDEVAGAGKLIPPAEAFAALKLVRRCLWRSKPACGCQAGHCAIRGQDVADQACIECIRQFGES